jgi:Na+/H+ antiporter
VSDPRLVIGLLAGVAVFTALARWAHAPAPIVLVLGGSALGMLPGVPQVSLSPEVVFYVFLPPLVYSAAVMASTTELRAEAVPIGQLAIGLVLVSTVAVAAVAHVASSLPWPEAFVLGGVLAPTDPLSTTTLLRRAAVPNRLITILEGESLVNDGTGLVVYALAIGAATGAPPSAAQAVGLFVLVSVGGTACGLAVGVCSALARRRLDDVRLELCLSLLTPFCAYLAADWLGVSGVLAAVTAGLVVGRAAPRILSSTTRLRYHAFWDIASFLLSTSLFLLMGLQLPRIVAALPAHSVRPTLELAGLATVTIFLVRFAWMFAIAPLVTGRRCPRSSGSCSVAPRCAEPSPSRPHSRSRSPPRAGRSPTGTRSSALP